MWSDIRDLKIVRECFPKCTYSRSVSTAATFAERAIVLQMTEKMQGV
jgi:hypothetical protein